MEIEVQNLTFSYGEQPALRNVSFSVQKGTLTAVLGANGAGKSTLFRCLLGFLTPQAGEIRLSGRPLSAYSRREAAEKIAYIPQSSEPIFNYTVIDTVLMGTTGTMNVLQRPGRRQQEAAMQALQRLGLEALAQRGIGTISGGERQLALIARALVQNAEILIMDEPTANLDFGNQQRVLAQIRALTTRGYTVLLSTHNPEHALRYAHRVLALQGGHIAADGQTETALTPQLLQTLYGIQAILAEVPTDRGTVRSLIVTGDMERNDFSAGSFPFACCCASCPAQLPRSG